MNQTVNKPDGMSEWPFPDVSQNRWNRLSERLKGYVEGSFLREIEAIEKVVIKSRRHGLRVIQGRKSERPPVDLVKGGAP